MYMRPTPSPTSAGLALLAVLASGCHDFIPLEADGRCGNLILEPLAGEDCDTRAPGAGLACGTPGTDHACLYVCPDETECPPGWRCGRDHVCRAASGRLDPVEVLSLPGGTFHVTDLDGDDRLDIVSVGKTAVAVAFGDAQARFSSVFTLPFTTTSGPAATHDLDGDGYLDLALPIGTAVQLLMGEGRSLVPHSVPLAELPPGELLPLPVRAVAPFQRQVVVGLGVGEGGARLEVLEAPGGTDAAEVEAALAGAGTWPAEIALGDLDGGGTAEELALTWPGAARVLIVSPACGGEPLHCTLSLRDSLALPADHVAGVSGTFFADLEGDGDPDLFVGVDGPEGPAVAVARGDGDGALGALVVAPSLAAAATCRRCPEGQAGRRDALLAVADMDGDGDADLVGRFGVFLVEEDELVNVSAANPPWADAALADFNLDGRLDVAGARPDAVDVRLNAGAGQFTVLRPPLFAEASQVRAGDFDGDLLPDVAVVEGGGTVVVLYNDARFPSQRVVAARLDTVGHLRALQSVRDAEPTDGLMLTGSSASGAGELAELVWLRGTSARRMVGPLDTEGPVEAVAVVRPGDGGPASLVATTHSMVGRRFWRAALPADFEQRALEVSELTHDGSCAVSPFLGLVLHVVDLDGAGGDDLLAIPSSSARGELPPEWPLQRLRIEGGRIACERLGVVAGVAPPAGIDAADVDGDGALDVLVTFDTVTHGIRPQDTPGPAGFAVWWGDGAGGLVAEPFVQAGDLSFPGAVGLVELDGAPGAELVGASERGVTRGDFTPDRRFDQQTGRDPIVRGGVVVRQVAGADADGDGLDDVLVSTDSEVFLFRQRPCTARLVATGGCSRREP